MNIRGYDARRAISAALAYHARYRQMTSRQYEQSRRSLRTSPRLSVSELLLNATDPGILYARETTGVIAFVEGFLLYLCLIMELDTNNATRGSTDIDDEKRLSAATKRVTLAPLHDDIHPELKPDGSSEGEYGLDAPVANVPSDMENTSVTAKAPEAALSDDTIAPPLAKPSAVTLPVQRPAATTATTAAPAVDFLPASPVVTKKRNVLPIVIGCSVATVLVIGIVVYFTIPK